MEMSRMPMKMENIKAKVKCNLQWGFQHKKIMLLFISWATGMQQKGMNAINLETSIVNIGTIYKRRPQNQGHI